MCPAIPKELLREVALTLPLETFPAVTFPAHPRVDGTSGQHIGDELGSGWLVPSGLNHVHQDVVVERMRPPQFNGLCPGKRTELAGISGDRVVSDELKEIVVDNGHMIYQIYGMNRVYLDFN